MRLIGYWDDGTAEWPDPRNFVDPGWDEREREQVADSLERGWVGRAYMGRSLCRMCSQPNGSLELSDGTFLWPEGLCHYVSEHAVRLPGDFVRHIISISTQMKDADIDDSWWKAQQCP